MTFTILYHPEVVSEDIPRLPKKERKSIEAAIEKRLTNQPEVFGAPLRKSLRGYKKLRVGDYRIVYRIEESKVIILVISNRSIVYEKYFSRFN